MNFYSYNELADDGNGNVMITLSEDEIIDQYWEYWYGSMCKKYGKDHVDATYAKQDCIDDFCVIHWAWKV